MDIGTVSQSAFTALTFIATPALLTNASCSLANSTITRMLRIRDTMSELLAKSETHDLEAPEDPSMVAYVNHIERQAGLLIKALNTVYLALGAFAGATLITLVGTAFFPMLGRWWYRDLAFPGVALGAFGVGCLIVASVRLFQATHFSHIIIREEAKLIRTRYIKMG